MTFLVTSIFILRSIVMSLKTLLMAHYLHHQLKHRKRVAQRMQPQIQLLPTTTLIQPILINTHLSHRNLKDVLKSLTVGFLSPSIFRKSFIKKKIPNFGLLDNSFNDPLIKGLSPLTTPFKSQPPTPTRKFPITINNSPYQPRVPFDTDVKVNPQASALRRS